MGRSNEEQLQDKARQEREKDEERKIHNQRTGGAPVEVGQTDEARQNHNERSGIERTEVLTED